jgi:hypothetical protein
MEEDNIGFIYILENEAMHGMCKIGITQNVENRIKHLDGAGIPYRFKCVFKCKVKGYRKVEGAIHKILERCRVKGKEFFHIDPEQVIPLLKLLQIEETTESISKDGQKNTIRKKKQKFSFEELKIKIGETITYAHGNIKVKVVENEGKKGNWVKRYGDKKIYSLSKLTEILLGRIEAPLHNWKYKDELLSDRRNKMDSKKS